MDGAAGAGRQPRLGWDTPSGESSAGRYFSPRSFGHTGYTGTSLWIDPERGLFIVLLTTRVNPTAENQKHVALRRAVADAVQAADPGRAAGGLGGAAQGGEPVTPRVEDEMRNARPDAVRAGVFIRNPPPRGAYEIALRQRPNGISGHP